jgi:DNA-binding LacI/PurR family transcriptional regulator
VEADVTQLNLEQIGARAGVSRSTVSRVVNGAPNVSDAVRKRVEAVIAETGYRPNAAAKSLASKRTGVIGLIIPSAVETLFDDPYFGRLILGVTTAANELEMTVALLMPEGDDEDKVVSRIVTPGLIEGAIITATHMHEPLISHLHAAGMPLVVVGRPEDDDLLATVDVDNRGGARKAAKHLVQLGRKRLAMIGAPADTSAGIDRFEGFVSGVEDAGLSLDGRFAEGDWSPASGERAMRQLLEEQPDAVFVASDRMAIGALRAIQDAGLRCPDDVALVAFDGLIPASQTNPRLTSVTQPVTKVGQRAVKLLRSAITGEIVTPEHVVFSTELVVRESCGAARTTAR